MNRKRKKYFTKKLKTNTHKKNKQIYLKTQIKVEVLGCEAFYNNLTLFFFRIDLTILT